MRALEDRPDLAGAIPRFTAVTLADKLSQTTKPFVLDVRTPNERRAARLAGSRHIPLPQLRQRLAEVPADRPVVVHCEGGYRSAIAASLLAAAGRTNVSDLVGGIKVWIASQLPTESDAVAAQACTTACAE
jgi:rhodanese-related sulfurtransferase